MLKLEVNKEQLGFIISSVQNSTIQGKDSPFVASLLIQLEDLYRTTLPPSK
jgi:hypothetical protein